MTRRLNVSVGDMRFRVAGALGLLHLRLGSCLVSLLFWGGLRFLLKLSRNVLLCVRGRRVGPLAVRGLGAFCKAKATVRMFWEGRF